MIGRAAMVSASKGISASYSCMPNCGAHGPQYLIDGNTSVLTGAYETMHTREEWCGAGGGCDAWNTNLDGSTVDNTVVANLGYVSNGYTNVNGLAEGDTYWWWTYWYGFEYDDGFDCRYEQDEYTGSEPAEVADKIVMHDATVYERSVGFGGFNIANLGLSGSSHQTDICSNHSAFTLRINFVLPVGAQLEQSRCDADTPFAGTYNDYNIYSTPTCAMDGTLNGHLNIPANRGPGGSEEDHNPKITFIIGGSQNGRSIDTSGTVYVRCSQ